MAGLFAALPQVAFSPVESKVRSKRKASRILGRRLAVKPTKTIALKGISGVYRLYDFKRAISRYQA